MSHQHRDPTLPTIEQTSISSCPLKQKECFAVSRWPDSPYIKMKGFGVAEITLPGLLVRSSLLVATMEIRMSSSTSQIGISDVHH